MTNIVTNIRIPRDLLEEVRGMPLEQRTSTKRVQYLLKLGMRYHAILERTAAHG